MEADTAENEDNRKKKADGDETLAELTAGYSPRQREAFLKGFRILADVAIRAHIQRQSPASGDVPGHDGEEEA